MHVSRRTFTASLLASVVLPTQAKAWIHGKQTGITTVSQAALSGGGFNKDISISNDGATWLLTYDGNNCWSWNASTSQWDNIYRQDLLPTAFQQWGQNTNTYPYGVTGGHFGLSAYQAVVAPNNSNRIYVSGFESDESNPSQGWLWYSNDKNATQWVDRSYPHPCSITHGCGPMLAVDPNNADHLYLGDTGGVIHESFDGGATFTVVNKPGGPLAGVPNGTATTAGITAGTTPFVLSFGAGAVPAAVLNRGTSVIGCFASNASNPASMSRGWPISTADNTAGTVTMGGTNWPLGPNVTLGDTIVFGAYPAIVFDPQSGTTTRSAHTVTKNVFIGWAWGCTTGVHQSTDGGATFASIAGPNNIRRFSMSNDSTLYATEFQTGDPAAATSWRWTLAGGWFNMSPVSSTALNGVAADPLNNGHVLVCDENGNVAVSESHGDNASWSNFSGIFTRLAGDVAWLKTGLGGSSGGTVELAMTNGSMVFDPVSSRLVHIIEGVGHWTFTAGIVTAGTSPNAVFPNITAQTKGAQSLICQGIVKPPGQPLLVSAQDRIGVQLVNGQTTEPNGDFGIFEQGHGPSGQGAHLGNGWGIDYAKDHASISAVVSGNSVWTSINSGLDWTGSVAPSIHSGNSGTCCVGNSSGSLSSMSIFHVGGSNTAVEYTTDGGTTWQLPLFETLGAVTSSPGGGSASAGNITPAVLNFDGYIDDGTGKGYTGNVLTVSRLGTGAGQATGIVLPGISTNLFKDNNNTDVGVSVSSQLTGSTGGVGTYQTSGNAVVYGAGNVFRALTSISNASPAVFTLASHSLSADQGLFLSTTGGLPTGLSTNTIYYVLAAGLTSNTFSVSLTKGGAAINTSSAGSGTHSIRETCTISNGGGVTAATITMPQHGIYPGDLISSHGQRIVFRTNGTLPSPLVEGQVYTLVANNNTANTFEIANSALGTPIITSTAGAGDHWVVPLVDDSNTNVGFTENIGMMAVGGGTFTSGFTVGDTVSGTGVTAGSKILKQVSGAAGGKGEYYLDRSSSTFPTMFSFSNFQNNVTTDLNTPTTFYAWGGSQFWRSTDSGANWSKQAASGIIGVNQYCHLASIPNNTGHILITGGHSASSNNTGLLWSIDAGASFHAVPGVAIAWQCAAGATKPGNAYPSIFFSGTLSGNPDGLGAGIFRSDNFDPANLGATPTWTRCCQAPGGNMDTSDNMFADLETYGTFYTVCGGTGYAFGRLT